MGTVTHHYQPELLGCLFGLMCLSCDGKLDPLEKLPEGSGSRPPTPGVHVVEPFDYHYSDEPFFDSISDRLELTAARGQTETGALVYVPDASGEVRLVARDLRSQTGTSFPASGIHLGVVTYADRTRFANERDPADRLSMAYVSGARRGGSATDFRGFHQDARERLPLVPLVIAPDAIELETRLEAASDFVSLSDIVGTRALGVAGQGLELWIQVTVPTDFAVTEAQTRFEGTLGLTSASGDFEVPIALTVLDFELDALAEHARFVGVTNTLTHNLPEFRDAILTDLRQHGVNALREDLAGLADYEELRNLGFDMLVNTDASFPAAEIPGITALSLRPLFNVPLFEPTDDELAVAVTQAESLRALGVELESEMTLDVARRAGIQIPLDAFAYAITTYELSDLHEGELDDFLALLDAIRADPANKEVALSGHYAEVFNGHVPHQARLLYGLWLAQSNLDFGLAYGYSMVDGQNPFTSTGHSGVAFPAELQNADGSSRRVMLPSLTWDAFRAGIDDLRYVLTARRLTAARPDLAARLDALLEPYGPLYDSAGDRVDYRHREGDVRATRAALAAIILEAL
jgi:hypothetical protein